MVFYGDKKRGEYGETRSTYEPKAKHYEIAKEYGVIITPSTNKLKKLNVYKGDLVGEIKGTDTKIALGAYKKKIASKGNYKGMIKIAEIGGMYQDGTPYGDYYTYLENPVDRYGNDVDAEQARQRYLIRHQHENKINKKVFEVIDEEGDLKDNPIDMGSPSFWADIILWGKKANDKKIVMKKDYAKLDQLSATHAITDDFEFDTQFKKIVEKRIKKLKDFIVFSKKFEEKNEKIIKDYMKKNEDELRTNTTFDRDWNFGYDDINWSSKFFTVGQFKNKNIEKIRKMYYDAIKNTATFERQLIFNEKILKDYKERLKSEDKPDGQNTATNYEIAKLADEANEEALANANVSGELENVLKKNFEEMTNEIEKEMGEAGEYGNEGGKVFAKTIKLKSGKEINVLLDKNKKFNLNSTVMDEDGDFVGLLVDFYDDFNVSKFGLEDSKGNPKEQDGLIQKDKKAEYDKVLRNYIEFRDLVKKTAKKYEKFIDGDGGDILLKSFSKELNDSSTKLRKKYKDTDDLIVLYSEVKQEFVEEFGDELPKEERKKYIEEIFTEGAGKNILIVQGRTRTDRSGTRIPKTAQEKKAKIDDIEKQKRSDEKKAAKKAKKAKKKITTKGATKSDYQPTFDSDSD